ncbi:class IV adenylate cyclase [Amycolatopsis sp. H20-H5]|uniref:class IV adenylate cyclase n=1 Tax=Amycolatopsis sp. H20-H5 TaxID=3046309 RepID=UPI002DBBB039|nr:CYTH domain-containing protein [Amycolatopsis sp. H20-H5]MEC3977917.1 CYTH domain-containing protein [Amycolatopsis sp. H20-H5]
MTVENEAKILDIDVEKVTAILLEHGVLLGSRHQRRYVYDIDPGDQSTWIRLRDDGERVTLAVKKIEHDGIDGTHEWETTVGDFDTANELLGRLKYTPKAYQENRRTSYLVGTVAIELDEWPLIPPYLEIEGNTADEVRETASLLGFAADQLTSVNTTKVYARYGIDLASISDLRF